MDCSRVLGCNGEMFSVLPDGRCSPASVPLPSCVLVVGMDLGFHDWGGGGGSLCKPFPSASMPPHTQPRRQIMTGTLGMLRSAD